MDSALHSRALPSEVIVKPSSIDNLGLFATRDLPKGFELGPTNIFVNNEIANAYVSSLKLLKLEKNRPNIFGCSLTKAGFQKVAIRTPMGGFVNYSKDNNCEYYNTVPTIVCLRTIRDVYAGEELTTEYWTYKFIYRKETNETH
tara:strand:+ start:579 stop:1010 length:432 start_codon:yes stop_codon:yes gene_type:complete